MTARKIRVAIWLSYLYGLESDDRYYAYPRSSEDMLEGDALRDAADEMHAFANHLSGGELSNADWRDATESFGSAVPLSEIGVAP